MCRAGYGIGRTRLGVDRPAARDGAPVAYRGSRVPAHVGRDEVEGAELVVATPPAPVRVLRAPARVLLGRRRRAFADPHAQNVTVRLRSPLVGPVVAYDPFSVDVMTDPYPVYRELRARQPRGAAAGVRRVRAHALRRRVEGAHRPGAVLDLRGPGVPPRGVVASPRRRPRPDGEPSPPDVLDARSARAHPGAPGTARPVPSARGHAARADRARAGQCAARRAGRPRLVRRPSRLCVAGGRAGGRGPARVPDRGRRAARRVGQRVRRARSRRRRHQRRGAEARTPSCTRTSSTWWPSGAPPGAMVRPT